MTLPCFPSPPSPRHISSDTFKMETDSNVFLRCTMNETQLQNSTLLSIGIGLKTAEISNCCDVVHVCDMQPLISLQTTYVAFDAISDTVIISAHPWHTS